MSDCPKTHELGAYHDGECSEAARAEWEAHVKACAACAGELARMQKLSDLLRRAARPAPAAEALERLHRSVDRLPQVGVWRLAAGFAAVAASILLVSSLWLWRISVGQAAGGPLPVWETVAVAPQDASGAAAPEQLARWIVTDLSRKNGHD